MAVRRGRRPVPIITDPAESAEAASLRYVSDRQPGIRRRRAGRRFRYIGVDRRPVRDPAEQARLRGLAIPPAWTDVWICPSPRGHLQATGRDARGRKQYRYHPRWRAARDRTKYERLAEFGRALPRVRAATARDLARPGLPREKVLATVVRLLESTAIRVGNPEYVRENGSFGLTTLRSRHAEVVGSTVRFQFRGKGGKVHQVDVADRRLARVVRRCQELPGQKLFQYLDDEGRPQTIDSDDVNRYLRALGGEAFTAKDFRTWAGTVLAAAALGEAGAARSPRQARRTVARAITAVAARLGNTAAICRKSYVHPAVVDAYVDGSLVDAMRRRNGGEPGLPPAGPTPDGGLQPAERCVLALLESRAAPAARAA